MHKTIGFYGAALLIIMTATGAAMIFKPVTQKVTNLFSTVGGEPNFGKSKPSAQHEPIDITQAILIANSVFKDGVSVYAHNSELLVARGDRVKTGQVSAKSGQSGNVDSPQLFSFTQRFCSNRSNKIYAE